MAFKRLSQIAITTGARAVGGLSARSKIWRPVWKLTRASQWLTDGAKIVGLATLALLGAIRALIMPWATVPDEPDSPLTQIGRSSPARAWPVTGLRPST